MAKMIDKGVNLHKRLACGDTVQGYKHGGKVSMTGVSVPSVQTAIDAPQSPLTRARYNNGVRGMKSGGKVCK